MLHRAPAQDVVQHHRQHRRAPSLVYRGLVPQPEVDIFMQTSLLWPLVISNGPTTTNMLDYELQIQNSYSEKVPTFHQ